MNSNIGVRLLELPARRQLDWGTAEKTLADCAAEGDDYDRWYLEQALEALRDALSDPAEHGVRAFPHRGTQLYLFTNGYEEDTAYDAVDPLWECGILDALGLEMLCTAFE